MILGGGFPPQEVMRIMVKASAAKRVQSFLDMGGMIGMPTQGSSRESMIRKSGHSRRQQAAIEIGTRLRKCGFFKIDRTAENPETASAFLVHFREFLAARHFLEVFFADFDNLRALAGKSVDQRQTGH